MGKKRKRNDEVSAPAETEQAPPAEGSGTDLKNLLERNQDGIVVVAEGGEVRYANAAAARLLKTKLGKLLGQPFEHPLEDGAMRTIDLHMKVEPVEWEEAPATYVLLRSLASQQSAFHVEWRIEAAEERAREYEERVRELEAQPPAASPGLEGELQSLTDRAQEAEAARERAEARAQQADSDLHEAEERVRRAEERAQEAETLMEEAETQALEAERTLEDNGDTVRALEEKLVEVERELELNRTGSTQAAELAAMAQQEVEERFRLLQAESEELHESLQEAREQLEDFPAQLAHANKRANDAENQLADAWQATEDAEKQRDELRDRSQDLEVQMQGLRQVSEARRGAEAELAEARGRLGEIEVEREALRAEVQELRQRNETMDAALAGALAGVQERTTSAENEMAEWRQLLDAIQKELDAANLEKAAAQTALEEAQQQRDAAQVQLAEAQALSGSADDELATLKARLDEVQAELALSLDTAANQLAEVRAENESAQQRALSAEDALALRPTSEELAATVERALEAEQLVQRHVVELDGLREQLRTAESHAQELPSREFLQQALQRAELAEEQLGTMTSRAEAAETLRESYLQAEEKHATQLAQLEQRARLAEERAVEMEAMLEEASEGPSSDGSTVQAAEQRAAAAEQKLRETEARLQQVADDADARVAQALAQAGGGEIPEGAVDPETERLAFQDGLTGLPNQNIIRRYLDYTLKQTERYDRTTALMCIDLDRFKVINDALGVKAGDEVLLQVAERLQSVVRESDVLGRRGEDEFSILLSEITGIPDPGQQVSIVAKRIFEVLAQPFVASGQKVYVGASIGISTSPGDAETAEQMLEHANSAMHRAKELGRGRYQFFTEELQTRNETRQRLDTELRQALENKAMLLLYQPIVQLASGRMVGVESLLRWQHPSYGVVGPDQFLEAAEETGVIVPIGRWAILSACERLAEWSRKGLDLFVSVNLSRRQFLQADLAATLLRGLEVTGAPAQNLVLEIPETIYTLDPSRVEPILQGLRQVGVRLALDRFGTGYSSLERLNGDLTTFLKIDRKFISNVPHNSQCVSISAAAMGLARSLGVKPVAVGIENEAQLKFCKQMDCELAQGNLIYTPVEADLVTDLARSGRVIR